MAPHLSEIAHAVARGERSAAEVTEASIARIEATDARVNAFTGRRFEAARAQAARIDAQRARGEPLGPLAGVPFAVKNLFDIAGEVTLAGSKVNRSHPPATANAVLVERLQAAGAVLVGSLNMDEYAYGFTTENTHYGPTRNPHNLNYTAGGSSGGSGAAVAAGQVPLALGSDTNGSIRVPSCWCATTGLKPSRERVSRSGVAPLSWTLDHIGPMARSAEDIARVLPFMAGDRGPHIAGEVAALLQTGSVQGLRIGIPVNWFIEKVDQHVLKNWQAALEQFEALGCHLVPLPRIDVEPLHEAGWVILQSELASLHAARLDRAELFDLGLLHRLKNGLGYSARDYGEALQRRSEALQAFLTAMRDIDAVITPGLGGEVDNPKWKALWPGKQLYNAEQKPVLHLAKSIDPSRPEAVHQVDALSGATLTSNGVDNLLKFWLGQNGFGPFIANLRAGEA